MLSVNNIANVFIDYFAEKGEENDLTNIKLNKTIHEILEGKETYGRIDESGMLVLPADDEDKDDDWS